MNRKKLLVLCVLAVCFCCIFCACDVSVDEPLTNNLSEQTEDASVHETLLQKTEEANTEGITVPDTAEEATGDPTVSVPNGNTGGSAITIVGALEEICTPDRVHNVTTAIYKSHEVMDGGGFYLTFQTIENYAGLAMTEQFEAIYYPEDSSSTSSSNIPFTVGNTYLLLLHRYRDVYADGDFFQINSKSFIVDVDDFENATLNGHSLDTQVKGMQITATTTLGDFITYLQEITADHPDFTGQDYINSNARVDIMTASPHVVTVTTSSITSSVSISTVTIRCRVDAVQKGTLTVGEYIDVMFPLDADVDLNQTFVLTLNDPMPNGMDWYMFSCKQAMYPVSELGDIMSIIQNTQVAQ